MTRREELLKLIDEESRPLLEPMIEDIVLLEAHLSMLRKLPFIEVDESNPFNQRKTVASKQYKDFLQQYINAIKSVEYVIYKDKRLEGEDVEDSPLRKWFKAHE